MVGTQVVYLDTHVLAWIWLGHTTKLGRDARKALDHDDLVAPGAALLELQMLHEIGRLRPSASNLVSRLATEVGLRVCDLPFRTIADYALSEGWTRDPFDRLIVANAKAANAPLVTRDERIAEHYSRVIW